MYPSRRRCYVGSSIRLLEGKVHHALQEIPDPQLSIISQFLIGESVDRFENRGTPAGEASPAYQLFAERGFNLGKDKNLNRVMADAGEQLFKRNEIGATRITSEEKLDFCGLIPDNAYYFDNYVTCIEFTWRRGDFLVSGNRSAVAQYILTKMQKYVRQLGWTTD